MATREEYIAEARARYGFMSWALDIPELVDAVFIPAIENGWGDAEIQGALQSTQWWKTTSEAQRTWTALATTDPGEAEARRQARRQEIADRAARLGVPLDADDIATIAEQSLMFAWDDQQINRAIAIEMHSTPPRMGDAATIAARYRQLAQDFGINIGEAGIQQWVKGTIAGEFDEDQARAELAQFALSRWPIQQIQDGIKAGRTVREIMDPYFEDAARLLERPVGTFTFDDPVIRAAMDYADPQTGVRRPMSLWEFQQHVRSTPEWDRTKQATDEAHRTLYQVMTMFGV